MPKTSTEAVQAFVAAINSADPVRIRACMTEDHTFTDALGLSFSGAAKMQLGWQHFLHAYPGYQINVKHVFAEGNRVALIGEATGGWQVDGEILPERWTVAAAWLAEVENQQIKHWSVFCDTTWVHPPAKIHQNPLPASTKRLPPHFC